MRARDLQVCSIDDVILITQQKTNPLQDVGWIIKQITIINRTFNECFIYYLRQAIWQYFAYNKMEQILALFKEDPSRKTKNATHAFYYIFTLCISEFYFGYNMVYLSAVDFNTLAGIFTIDFDVSLAQGLFQGVLPIGGAFGAVSSSYFIRLLSRRNLLFAINAFALLLCVLSIVPNYQLFFIVRFFQGASCGLFSSVIPTIIREASPHEISSITGSFANAFIIFGLFFLYLFGYLLGIVTGDTSGLSTWKVVFLFPIITILFQMLLLVKVYPFQTPKYLAEADRKEELRDLMKIFYKIQHVQEMYDHYMKHHGPSQSHEEEEIHKTRGSRCALFYAIFYALLCPMSGINVMMSYGGEVISAIAPNLKAIMPALLMLFFFFTSILALPFLRKYGRKQLTNYGTIGLLFSLLVISLGYYLSNSQPSLSQLLIVIFLFIYLLVYGITFAPVMWIWVSEATLPQEIGYAIMVNWGGAASVMIAFPILLDILPDRNPAAIFLFFAVFLAASLIVTSRCMLETKDKHEHQIQEEYHELDRKYFSQPDPSPKQTEMNLLGK